MRQGDSEILDHAVKSWPIWGTVSAALLGFIYFLIRFLANRLADEVKSLRLAIERLEQRQQIIETIIPQVAGHESQIGELFTDTKLLNTRVSRIEGAHRKTVSD